MLLMRCVLCQANKKKNVGVLFPFVILKIPDKPYYEGEIFTDQGETYFKIYLLVSLKILTKEHKKVNFMGIHF